MWFRNYDSSDSKLFSEKTFDKQFVKDMEAVDSELYIESAFLTLGRFELLSPTLSRILNRGVKVIVVTRDPMEHGDEYMQNQAANVIMELMEMGIEVRFVKELHRKVAIIDGKILWEGSLNILSWNGSVEMMRRWESEGKVREIKGFI